MPKCVYGQNFGKYALSENSMQLFYSPSLLKTPIKDPDQAILSVDYDTMALINATGKNEVSIELKEPKQKSADFVTELRFFVQNNEA